MIHVLMVHHAQSISKQVIQQLSALPDLTVTTAKPTARELTRVVGARQQVDVLLVDSQILKDEGFRVLSALYDETPDMKVTYLCHAGDTELMIAALAAGADGILYEDVTAVNIHAAIKQVMRNITIISGVAAQLLAEEVIKLGIGCKHILRKRFAELDVYLTPRELDIALLVMDNLTNKEIARTLYLSEGTTKNYISSLYDKLQLRSRSDVITYLHGLIADSDIR